MENQTLSIIASLFAMIAVILSYFVKKKALYLLFQLICIVFLIISYFFNLQFFAMVGLSIGFARALTFYLYEKKGVKAPLLASIILSVLTLASYFIVNTIILKTSQPLDLLCVGALVSYAFIFRIRNLKLVRFLMLPPTILSILFNLLTGAAIFATLTYVFELCANVISIFKYHVLPRKKNITE